MSEQSAECRGLCPRGLTAQDYRLSLRPEELAWLRSVAEAACERMLSMGTAVGVAAIKSGEATRARRVLGQLRRLRSMEEMRESWVDVELIEEWHSRLSTVENGVEEWDDTGGQVLSEVQEVRADMWELVEPFLGSHSVSDGGV